jgi:hypothetical protein
LPWDGTKLQSLGFSRFVGGLMGKKSESVTWGSLAEAARLRGCSRVFITSGALRGEVRTLALPGRSVMFCLEDAKGLTYVRNARQVGQTAGV